VGASIHIRKSGQIIAQKTRFKLKFVLVHEGIIVGYELGTGLGLLVGDFEEMGTWATPTLKGLSKYNTQSAL